MIYQQCLSPVIKLHPNSDANMLQIDSLQTLSNALQPDLVPTKDTAMHTSSASSEFEETWPSTDLTESTKMQSPIQFNHKSKEDEIPGDAIAESNESKSTIARYMHMCSVTGLTSVAGTTVYVTASKSGNH